MHKTRPEVKKKKKRKKSDEIKTERQLREEGERKKRSVTMPSV
jgi:hypothetical protein